MKKFFLTVAIWFIGWPVFGAIASLVFPTTTTEIDGKDIETASGWAILLGLLVSSYLTYLVFRKKRGVQAFNRQAVANSPADTKIGLSGNSSIQSVDTTESNYELSGFERIFGPSAKTKWLLKKELEKQEAELAAREREIERLKSLASHHEEALIKNWQNTVTADEYGKKNYSSWNREVVRFFGSTDFRPEFLSAEHAVELITEIIEETAVPNQPAEEQSIEEKAEQLKLLGVVEKHKNALIRNWHKLVETDDYGSKNLHSWHEEIYKFFDSVNFRPKAMDVDYAAILATYLVEDMVTEGSTKSVFDYAEVKSAYDFEEKCAEELSLGGWNTQLTSGSGDQGIDVVAEKDAVRVVIQCKLYSKPVGNKAVQEALSGKAFEKADFAAVVAPNGYTKSAIELANRTGVFLLSQNDLKVLSRYTEQ